MRASVYCKELATPQFVELGGGDGGGWQPAWRGPPINMATGEGVAGDQGEVSKAAELPLYSFRLLWLVPRARALKLRVRASRSVERLTLSFFPGNERAYAHSKLPHLPTSLFFKVHDARRSTEAAKRDYSPFGPYSYTFLAQ